MKKTAMILAALMLASCAADNNAQNGQDTQAVSGSTSEAPVISSAEVTEAETSPDTADTSDTAEKPAEEKPAAADGEVEMSAQSGFYDEEFDLELTAPEGYSIYYTTDGSDPDATKTPYTKPIHLRDRSPSENILSSVNTVSPDNMYIPKTVKKANIIRAVAVDANGAVTKTVSRTFFVGVDRYDIPVISLISDPKGFFNKQTGIYVLGDSFEEWKSEQTGFWQGWQAKGNFSNKGREWERPVTMEYITAEGTELSQDCGIRIMGAVSRTNAQKSFRLIARDDYGKKNFKYPLIPDNMRSDGSGEVKKYRSFILRNGGNDCDTAKLRDPVLQTLMDGTGIETMQYTPVVVYLDGEYWGMYTLAEDYSDHYIENNYSREDGDVFDDNNVIFLKKGEIEDGEEEDIELYTRMYDFAVSNDLNIPENYEKLASMIDLDELADYYAFNLYIHNSDSIFEGNNWAMWRVRETDDRYEKADGKWRIMIYDTEYSCGVYDDNEFTDDNVSKTMTKELPDEVDEDGNFTRDPLRFFRVLTDCDVFRAKLVNSLCDIRNINFEHSHAVDTVMAAYDQYVDYVPDTFDRFGPDWVVGMGSQNRFDYAVQSFANYLDERYSFFPGMVKDAFGLGEPSELKVICDDTKGTVYLNGKKIPADFKGVYFREYPVTLTVETDGKADVSAQGASVAEDGGIYTIRLDGDSTVTVSIS